MNRASGVLLHPTSLPGTFGIGTIGKQAFKFVDWLVEAKQSLWQILPIGPTGYGDSPYASFSTFAGNPLLIDLDKLIEKGFLSESDANPPEYIKIDGNVDFGAVVYWKKPLLNIAAKNFLKTASKEDSDSFNKFKKENKAWLDDYALFMSIKSHYDAEAAKQQKMGLWNIFWPHELAVHDKNAVEKWYKEHKEDCECIKAIQYFFYSQWEELHEYAKQKGISIIGDIPIFVAQDSADVWANQRLFQLDENGIPLAVAGVPPDYFSATGQLWGNPLYKWETHKEEKYSWWIFRIKNVLKLVDYVRIDHFRGFEAYWSVPYGEETAINGKWIKGPDHDLFNTIKKKLGASAIIAEDLGLITDEVKKLRDDFDLPGMKIIQFAFDVNEENNGALVNSFLPHMYNTQCIAYTGTHDNDTTQSFLEKLPQNQFELIAKYMNIPYEKAVEMLKDKTLCLEMVRMIIASVASFAVIPLQDIFALGNEGRMNAPSTTGTNWQWRMTESMFDSEKAALLRKWSVLYGRNVK